MKKYVSLAVIALSISALTGCLLNLKHMQIETAKRIASPSFMYKRIIDAAPFNLTAYERVRENGNTVNIYIEGDGYSWVSRKRKSGNPTPKNPLGLRLAAMDGATNVIYLARPCQYSNLSDTTTCPNKYWTSHKYSPIIINSIHAALDDIKIRYNTPDFNLIGYSGGGAIATLVASDRDDIVSIRTVAGNLDINRHTDFHKVTKLSGSLNPADIAAKIAHIPQRHFVGALDTNITPEIFYSYAKASKSKKCLNYNFVSKADHADGWVERWTVMLKEPVQCNDNIDDIIEELTPEIEQKIEKFNEVAK